MKNSEDEKKFPDLINYRPDIDGIRALAVLSVVIFHFKRDGLENGYLGVDIFFVISGYLITKIISRELKSNSFSIKNFYERRVRRLAPALLCVLAATTIIASIVLLPLDLEGYGRSMLATIFFVANIYFWRDTDYFSRAAEEKPLLHMWSLSVEEQFYLIFPLALLVVHRLSPTWVRYFVLFATVGSLVGYLIANKLGAGNPAFFLLPTRAWELGAGATLAMFGTRGNVGTVRQLAALFGLILIASALAGIDWTPGYSLAPTIPVVAGTLLLIWGGEGKAITSGLLSHPLVVRIGQISYSMYLWHWPIVVFITYFLVRELTWHEAVAAFICLWVVSTFSERYIEAPARARTIPFRAVAKRCAAVAVALVVVGTTLVIANGFPARMPPEAARINAAVGTNYRCPIEDYMTFGGSRACALNLASHDPDDTELVLLGNSHAQMYAPLVEAFLKETGKTGLLVPVNSCAPIENFNISTDCITIMNANIEAVLALPKAKSIIISFDWTEKTLIDASGMPASSNGIEAIIAGVDQTISRFQSAGYRVLLVGPIATPEWDVASILSRSMIFQRPLERPLATPKGDFEGSAKGKILRHYMDRKDIILIQPHRAQCDERECNYLKNGASLFADSNHIAEAALVHFKDEFSSTFKAAGIVK